MSLPAVGTRLSVSGYLGTIRCVGPVNGTKGDWLGVEWDDPSRGKHDGSKDGQKYFDCLIPNSGSFLRPNAANIDYGTSFLQALVEKYVEIPRGSSGNEFVVLGSSNGSIQVEAVNLDKIRGKFARLERLRDVSLDKEKVSCAGETGTLREKCPSIRGVDLSFSLIPSWDVIALIAMELPLLERLALNNNRFQSFANTPMDSRPFERLVELQLSGTLMSWQGLLDVFPRMPSLAHVEMGYNLLKTLSSENSDPPLDLHLQLINLDTNQLTDWEDICVALWPMKRLTRLILTQNPIVSIPVHPPKSFAGQRLPWKYLSLASTRIEDWSSIDALAGWCPHLEGLSLFGTPLVDHPEHLNIWRQLTIARLPVLRTLDGAPISDRQRTDAELFYITFVARADFATEIARHEAHPRWAALCKQHGSAAEPAPTPRLKENKLSSRLIQIDASLVHAPQPPTDASLPSPTAVRILPSAPLRTARLKLLKSLKAPAGAQAGVWVRMTDGSYAAIGDADGADESREIGWWLEQGSRVVLCVKQ